MTFPRFFGYGSLVNALTHDYPGFAAARLTGWRRLWVCVPSRPVAFLSVRPEAGSTIDGAVADVPNADFAQLDTRERGYTRSQVHGCSAGHPVWLYQVAARNASTAEHVILRSYLDTVAGGFAAVHGRASLARFFATTDGWDIPIADDRAAPRYPRYRPLAAGLAGYLDQLVQSSRATTRAFQIAKQRG